MLMSNSSQFGRFLLTGIFNTANGYAAVLLLQVMIGRPFLANLFGYLFAGAVGYLAHSKFTFRAKANSRGAARYAAVLGISYMVNLISLKALLLILAPMAAQVVAVSIFTILCYIGQSRFTFTQ